MNEPVHIIRPAPNSPMAQLASASEDRTVAGTEERWWEQELHEIPEAPTAFCDLQKQCDACRHIVAEGEFWKWHGLHLCGTCYGKLDTDGRA